MWLQLNEKVSNDSTWFPLSYRSRSKRLIQFDSLFLCSLQVSSFFFSFETKIELTAKRAFYFYSDSSRRHIQKFMKWKENFLPRRKLDLILAFMKRRKQIMKLEWKLKIVDFIIGKLHFLLSVIEEKLLTEHWIFHQNVIFSLLTTFPIVWKNFSSIFIWK